MTLMEFFGCALTAFGPPFSMFYLTVAKDPIRIIIMISAAFFWLVSLLLSSIFWLIFPIKEAFIVGIIFSVTFQEAFRYFFYRLLRKAEVGLQKVSEVGVQGHAMVTDRVTLSYVGGLGFGVMSGAFSLVNVLADAAGPGTVGLKGDSHFFFIASAFTTLAFILLHTFWGVIFFQAIDVKNWPLVAYVVITHLLVSCLTLVNGYKLYLVSIVPIYLVTIATGYIAFTVAGGSFKNIKNTFNT